MKSILLAILAVLIPANAAAQERPTNAAPEGWSVTAGAGALLSPTYLGDDAYNVSAVPFVRAAYGDQFFASVQEGLGYNLINDGAFRAGPLVSVAFGRDEDGGGPFRIAGNKTNDLLGLGDIDTSVSLGGFVEYDTGSLLLSAKAGQAVSGHDGLTGELGVSYKGTYQNNGPPIIYSVGPRLNFGGNDYMDAFFGVTADQSLDSGLTPYNPDGGLVSYGVSGTAILPLSQTTSITLIASYNRLASDAADSSLVTERGSADQGFVGLVTAYRFK